MSILSRFEYLPKLQDMSHTLNAKGRLLSLETPVVMGILNVTPDSFYDGGRHLGEENLLAQVSKMLSEGAGIIDVGGQSTRPGSTAITTEEEINRVIPVIQLLHRQFPDAIISIDTYYSKVAELAIDAGASIVNDVSAGLMDEDMIPLVGSYRNVPYICMHMRGTPQNMQDNPVYENVVAEVIDYFVERTAYCRDSGIQDLILDPGFGFGKTVEHNFQLLKNLSDLQILQMPILAGLSRKGMIWRSLEISPQEALNGTTVLNTLALEQGAQILRVHDVKEAREAIHLHQCYKKSAPKGASIK